MEIQYVVVEGNTLSAVEEQQLAYQIADEALITHSVILSTPRRNIFDAKFTVEFRGRSYPLVVAVKKIDGIYDFFSSIGPKPILSWSKWTSLSRSSASSISRIDCWMQQDSSLDGRERRP